HHVLPALDVEHLAVDPHGWELGQVVTDLGREVADGPRSFGRGLSRRRRERNGLTVHSLSVPRHRALRSEEPRRGARQLTASTPRELEGHRRLTPCPTTHTSPSCSPPPAATAPGWTAL